MYPFNYESTVLAKLKKSDFLADILDNGEETKYSKKARYINNNLPVPTLNYINKESYEKHFGNREAFRRLGVDLDNDSNSVIRFKYREKQENTNGKSTNYKSTVSKENRIGGRQRLTVILLKKYSRR